MADEVLHCGRPRASNLDNPAEFTAVLRAFLDRVTVDTEAIEFVHAGS